jgi:hypothetical protein
LGGRYSSVLAMPRRRRLEVISSAGSPLPTLSALELEMFVSRARSAEILGVSTDTIDKFYGDKFVLFSPRNKRIKLRDLLTPPPDIKPARSIATDPEVRARSDARRKAMREAAREAWQGQTEQSMESDPAE